MKISAKDGGGAINTGKRGMDDALLKAAQNVAFDLDEVEIAIDSEKVCIEIIGGTWLGKIFGRRIQKRVRFAEGVSKNLEKKYEALPVGDWLDSGALDRC